MKILLLIFLSLYAVSISYSQDLIVTNDGDSINCKITKIKAENIYFTFKHKDEIRNTLLPTSQVLHHQVDYYITSEVPKEKLESYKDYPQFRIAVNGGFSYMTGKISDKVPSEFRDYIKELKSGNHLGGDASFFFSESLGFGAKYYVFKSSYSLDEIYVEDVDGNITYGKMSDAIKISFIGPSFSVRTLNYNKKNALLFSISIGYMDYVNDKVVIDSFKMTGNTVGFGLDIGYDIGLSENFALGFQVSLLAGTLSEYVFSDGTNKQTIKLEEGEYENISRFDLSVGLRFIK
ncbi:hypothetical protein G3O08_12775 [Cryomorpha ignava]|uniref:Outer membrane protein beta-barrel domain-containing protein n=1 Tax=Cryomorpha ignava TaxID=101383 RepID=A0A7K3WS86_9FLAO|nr:hypothetical protein [Cryomorpha ignava]NEN24378.1 hypothetical protein [Cryomorpha ignava]